MKAKWTRWLFERFHLGPLIGYFARHRVARQPWYFGDGAALFLLFCVLLGTGMFLALGYNADTASAYESVERLTFQNDWSAFVRALHYWSAGLMIVVMLYHVLRHIVLGGYLPPREGTWLIGVGLFFLVLTTSVIGYMLRWDERGLYALQVALNIFHKVPIIGEDLVILVQGGLSTGNPTLSRLYAVHVLFIPLTLLGLILWHLYLVLIYGTTTPLERRHAPETAEEQISLRTQEAESEKHGQDFFPYMAGKSGAVAFSIFALAATLAWFVGPPGLMPKADYTAVSAPREEWWMAWYSSAAALLPPTLAPFFYWLFPLLVLLGLIALPFIDHGSNRDLKRRPLAVLFALTTVIMLLGLGGLRARSPWTAWPNETLPPLPPQTSLTEAAEQGRKLFLERGCHSCHAIGGRGPSFGPNLTGLPRRLSEEELRRFISRPPEGTAMPDYETRLSPEEIDALTAFVLVAQTFPRKY